MKEKISLQVVCGIVLQSGRILATRRDAVRRYPLMWEFPGGKLEPNESPDSALHRELQEELELQIRDLSPLPPVDFDDGDFSIRLIPFICRVNQKHGPVPRDHGEIRWITPDDALLLTWAPADIPLVHQLSNLVDFYDDE